MCGRIGSSMPRAELLETYHWLRDAPEELPRYNIAPTDPVMAVGPNRVGAGAWAMAKGRRAAAANGRLTRRWWVPPPRRRAGALGGSDGGHHPDHHAQRRYCQPSQPDARGPERRRRRYLGPRGSVAGATGRLPSAVPGWLAAAGAGLVAGERRPQPGPRPPRPRSAPGELPDGAHPSGLTPWARSAGRPASGTSTRPRRPR